MNTEKAQENKLRRKLWNQGFLLRKSRQLHTDLNNHGGYMIVDAARNSIEAGEHYDMFLDDIERFVNG